jgi:hypothetical protein
MKATAKSKAKKVSASMSSVKMPKSFMKVRRAIRSNLKTIIPTLATIAVGARLLQRRAENFVK